MRAKGFTAAVLLATLLMQPACAAGVEDFYRGKSLSLLIGYSVGGGYDAYARYARLLARHLGRHIPGNPAIVAQNMTGAGSLKAANYLYSVAPRDGSVIGTFSRSQGIAPLIGKAEFDSTRFTWLGSITDEVCGLSWSTLKGRYPHWLRDKKVNILVQAGIRKQAELPDVPAATELAQTPDQTQILRLLLIGQAMARPFAAPPDIPADRRAALIEAFERTVKDPDFLADAQRLDFDVNPVTGARLDALLAEAYATPKDIVAKAAKAMSD